MGQAKVRYFDPRQRWMRRILAEIHEYSGPSVVVEPEAEIEVIAAVAGEAGQAGGHGFAVDPRVRRLVDQRAIALARRAYSRAGYEVRVVGHPFDLHCHRETRRKPNTGRDLWVEVKGTQGAADQVILTRGEVEFYSKRFPRTELFLVNAIRIERGLARGGKPIRYRRWRPRADALRPITYWYRLPEQRS